MATITQVQTRFGSITESRMLSVRRGWLRAGTRTIPLSDVKSVRQRVHRRPGLAVVLLLLASACYAVLSRPEGVAVATILSALGAILLWGSPFVVITTNSGHTRRVIGAPWSFAEADRFVAALRRSILDLKS